MHMAGRNASPKDVGDLRPLCKECLEEIGPEALCRQECFMKDVEEHRKAARKGVMITYGSTSTFDEVDEGVKVCSICLKNLPKNLTDLSTAVCRRVEHSKFFKQGFQWLTPSTSILRPTPYNVFKMSQKGQTYCNNHDYQSCHWIPWYECIFPHNQVEEMWWNQWQKKHINENSLTDVGKMFYIQFREKTQQQPDLRVEAEQRSVYHNCPPVDISSRDAKQLHKLHEGMTAANYKSRFRTLIYLEMKQIESRLSNDVGKRGQCGHTQFEVSSTTFNKLTLAMDNVTAEFVMQNSRDVVLNCCQIGQPALTLKAVTLNAKNGLTVQILPTAGVSTPQILEQFPVKSSICATFKPNLTYWEPLHKAIEDIPDHVITGILFPVVRDFNTDGSYSLDLAKYTALDPILELDGLYQTDALNTALRCPPGPPFLLTGPFGTGKTRLIARLAHQILHVRPKSRVLICVHHIQTADSYLDSFFLKLQDRLQPCDLIRLLGESELKPSEFYFTKERVAKDSYYKRIAEIHDGKPRLVVATTRAAMQLKKIYGQDDFTHIFIDEAAQCIEPDAIIPLHLAGKHTKILLAGDHLQVGPDDAVQCKEAKENGLSDSLLTRLHSLYLQLEKDSGVAGNPFIKCFTSPLLSNYRCDPGILRLPSNLFYESSLLPQVSYEQHPDVNCPLHFVCTSMDQNGHQETMKEVLAVLETAQSLANHWPVEWNEYGEENAMCLMARSYQQMNRLRMQMRNKFQSLEMKKQNGMVVDKLTFAIQGLEFTAVLLSTAEEASGFQTCYGRSVVNERVFNTVLTRARALFVAFGNPFQLLKAEKDSRSRCWKEFLKRCIECDSINMPETTTEDEKQDLFTKVFKEEVIPPVSDSILESYEKEFRQRLHFSRGHWQLIEKAADHAQQPKSSPVVADHSHFILECKTAKEAEAVPLSGRGEHFIITGTKSRGQALHGAIVEVRPLKDSASHSEQRQGKVEHLVEQSPQRLFLCKMDPFNSNLFIPLDGKGPKLVNFPPISRRLLQDSKAVEETLGKNKKSPVACFDGRGLEKGIPRLKDVIPFETAKNLIFLVKFIEWQSDRIYPLAAVIDIFPPAHTAFHTERMLKAAYSEMMTPPPIVPQARAGPLKFDAEAITVDSKGTQHYDDAISIVKKSTGSSTKYTVGVHIVNVASQLPHDVAKEVIARGSAVTLDSVSVISPMMPQNFVDSVSLVACKVRSCLTVSTDIVITEESPGTLTTEEGSEEVEGPATQVKENFTFVNTKIKRSNVLVLKNYTFDEAQDVLNKAPSVPRLSPRSNCTDQLCNLYIVSKALREKRIGHSVLLLPCHDKESPSNVDVQAMVEELMLWANTEVAKYISHSSSVALLLCQPAPDKGNWRELEQQQKVLCSSDGMKTGSGGIPIVVVRRAAQCIMSDPRTGKCILSTESHYPQLLALNEKVLSVQNRASYHIAECKERRSQKELPNHHSVGSLYTHFTAPFWRGFDILVQQALLSTLDGTDFPFKTSDCSSLATLCDQKRRTSRKIAKEYQQMNRAVTCFHNHYAVDTVVISVQEKTLKVKAPSGPFATDALTLSVPALNLSNLEIDSGNGRLTWKFKIFSADPWKPISLQCLEECGYSASSNVKIREVCLRNSSAEEGNLVQDYRYARVASDCVNLKTSEWTTVKRFLRDPCKQNSEETLRMLSKLHMAHFLTSISYEELERLVFVQVEVTKQVSEGSMLRVWLGSTQQGPRITTEVHVVQPVPFLSICHKHNTNPSECFSNAILHNASLDHYYSMEHYLACWEDVLLAEAAQGSPSDSEVVVLQNVTLHWPAMKKVNSAIYEPHFIPKGNIGFSLTEQFLRQSESEISIKTGDFICAHYEVPDKAHSENDHGPQSDLFAAPKAARGVFHFVVAATSTIDGEGEEYSLKTVGNQNAPVSLRMQQVVKKEDAPCTLQVIPCTVSYRRLYRSLRSLNEATPEMPPLEKTCTEKQPTGKPSTEELPTEKPPSEKPPLEKPLVDIALGSINLQHSPKSPFCPEDVKRFMDKYPHILSLWRESGEALPLTMNQEQKQAIQRALESSYFLIQGPPGTGKSETGAHLAYAFARLNKVKCLEKCVLYCGPSNKAVNVVLEKLARLCECLKDVRILRIYSRTGEQVGRTGPRNIPGLHKPLKAEGCPPHLEPHTLHYKVLNGPSGDAIRKFEEKFELLAKKKKLPSKDMADAYRKCKSAAEKKVFEEGYDIILCTCNEAAGVRIERHFNVAECIIDECGMAMEPESMAVIRHAHQVVLIGDHKQLQPVLQNRLAEDNGLGRSLFERYADMCERKGVKKDGSGCFIQLKEQYRMHHQVCQFPSKYFYDDSLESAMITRREFRQFCADFPKMDSFWPCGKDKPIVFYSVEGSESSPTSTEKVRLQSICNEQEAMKIVEILLELVKVRNLQGKCVTVLTPYSAQVECIKARLEHECSVQTMVNKDSRTALRLKAVKVQTINDSQGSEFPLVILSLVRSMPRANFEPELVRGDRSWLNEHLGFVTNPHQICVGITRSKFGLIIVGNHHLLSCDVTWNELIQEYKRNRCLR